MQDDFGRPHEQEPVSLAVIAGAGRLPAEAAAVFRASGSSVVAIGFSGITDPGLEAAVSSMCWLQFGQLDALASALRDSGVSRLLLLGKVSKSWLFSDRAELNPDATAMALLSAQADRSDDGLLAAIAAWLESLGFELMDQRIALASMLAPVGPLTKCLPSEQAQADLASGWPVVEALGRSGVGQCVVVKQGAVLSVEAMEGTDDAIRRAGRLGGPGATVIKALRAAQDRRFDLPAVGPGTIEVMLEAGARALAIEAGATLVVEGERCIAEADRAGIAIWGFDSDRGPT